MTIHRRPLAMPSRAERKFAPHALSALSLLDSYISRHRRAVILAGLVILFARAYVMSQAKPLISDEMLTYIETQSPSLGALWSLIRHVPITVDPPLYATLSFFAARLPLPLAFALRLPSFISYAAMMLSLYTIMRKRAPITVALIAFALPMLLPTFDFALQARPYALLLGLSGLTLAFWQHAAQNTSRRLPAMLLMLLTASCAVLTHYFAPLLFVPLIAGELWRSFRSQINRGMWIAFALAASVMIIYIPFLRAASGYRAAPWHGVFFEELGSTFMLGIAPVVLVTLSLCALAWLAQSSIDVQSDSWSAAQRVPIECPGYESVALATLYLIPLVAFGGAKLFTHIYLPRYSIIFSLGAVLLMSAIFGILTRSIRGLTAAIFIILLVYAAHPLTAFLRPLPKNIATIDSSSVKVLDRFGQIPIATADWDPALRLCLFAPETLRRRIVLIRSEHLTEEAVHHAMNLPYETYREFVNSHDRFLLVGTDRLREDLLKDGRRVVFVGIEPDQESSPAFVKRDVYLVEMLQH